MLLRAFLVLGCVYGSIGLADDSQSTKQGPSFLARFSEDGMDSGARRLYVYSKNELKSVEFKFKNVTEDSWSALGKAKADGIFAYGTSSYIPTKAGQEYLVRGVLADGSRVTDSLTVVDADSALTVAFAKVESKDVVAKDLASRARAVSRGSGDMTGGATSSAEARFMSLLNNYRVRMGRQPVSWCPSCASASYRNNCGGGAHNYMGPGRAQNWAGTGSPEGAFRMWQNSSGHNANMLASHVRYAGVSFRGNEATLTLR